MNKSQLKKVAEGVSKWLFFAVTASIAPLIARWWNLGATFNRDILREVAGRGELYLIAAALTGEAIGEAIYGKTRGCFIRIFKTISIGSCGLVIYVAASAYQRTADLLDTTPYHDQMGIALQSSKLFILALIAACGCISVGCNAK